MWACDCSPARTPEPLEGTGEGFPGSEACWSRTGRGGMEFLGTSQGFPGGQMEGRG